MIDSGGNPYETVISDCPCDVSTTVIARDYGLSAISLNQILMTLGVQYKAGTGWVLRSDYVGHDYTHHGSYTLPNGRTVVYSVWTQRGRRFLYEFLKKHGYVPLIELSPVADRQLSIADC